MKTPRSCVLPCCGETVKVTSRPSRIKARYRNHHCPKCKMGFKIDAKPVDPKVVSDGAY